jgi:hypothetical protein
MPTDHKQRLVEGRYISNQIKGGSIWGKQVC